MRTAGVWKAWLALASFWTCFFIAFCMYLLPRTNVAQTQIYNPQIAASVGALPEIRKYATQEHYRSSPKIVCRDQKTPFIAPTDGTSNFCLESRLVPKLYVLGAQKAGTSSLSASFQNHDVFFAPGLEKRTNTEWNFFVWNLLQYRGANMYSVDKARQSWLEKLPYCAYDVAVLLADDSPDYLALVPLPCGTQPLGFHWGPLFSKEFCHKPHFFKRWRAAPHCTGAPLMNLPLMLSDFYGPTASGQVSFLILLREPLERMHSAWYQASAQGFKFTCVDCMASSFQSALSKTIHAARRTPPEFEDWYWFSLYGRHLQHWLSYFSAKQFYFVPMRVFIKCGMDVCSELAQSFTFHKDCSHFHVYNFGYSASHRPELRYDLDNYDRQQFDEVMSPEVDLLVNVLCKAHEEGAHLVAFKPKSALASHKEIREWLFSGW